jgi:hypothetical protein
MFSSDTFPRVLLHITCIYQKHKGDYALKRDGEISVAEVNMDIGSGLKH